MSVFLLFLYLTQQSLWYQAQAQAQASNLHKTMSEPVISAQAGLSEQPLCWSRDKPTIFMGAGLSQQPLPEQAQASDLHGRRPKLTTSGETGLNDLWDFRATSRSTKCSPEMLSDL